MASSGDPAWSAAFSSEDWDRLDSVQLPMLVDLPPIWSEYEMMLARRGELPRSQRLVDDEMVRRLREQVNWAGSGFTVRNDESTT
jgi:hypothetical protein